MKTTFEMPDPLFRRAKARAEGQGISFSEFVIKAVEEKLTATKTPTKPWMRMAGGLQHLSKETAGINRLIEEEFERIEH